MFNEKDETRYFYFRMSDSLFNYEMIKLEAQPGGYEFEIILLKLYALSCRWKGYLKISKTKDGLPDYYTLALLIRHDVNILTLAIHYFLDNGLMEIIQEDEKDIMIYFPEMRYRIGGKSTIEADKKRYKRLKENNLEVELLQPETVENKELSSKMAYKGIRENVFLSDSDYEKLKEMYLNANQIIDKLSIWIAKKNCQLNDHFAWCISFAQKDGKRNPNSKLEVEKKKQLQYRKGLQEAKIGIPPSREELSLLTEDQLKELETLSKEKTDSETLAKETLSKEKIAQLKEKYGIDI